MKLRYNKTFKQGMVTLVLCFLLFGYLFACTIIAKVQYDDMVANMKTTQATIIDIDIEHHRKGPHVQRIYITYKVDGVAYNRELDTDTKVSFEPGRGSHYSIGDKVEIFYDAENPEVIAFSRSVKVGYNYMIISFIGLALISFVLYFVLKHRRKFLITQEEYDKEKEKIKAAKRDKKKKKRKRKLERQKKYATLRKIGKIILIILGTVVGAFVLFLLFGAFLKLIGY